MATKAQQKVLDEMRAAKNTKPVEETAEDFLARMLDGMPSGKRTFAAFFVTVSMSFGTGYGIGTLAGYAITAIATLGGSVLWSYLLMILALMLSMYAGMKIGQHVGGYILSGQIDHDLIAAKNKVCGWFGSGKGLKVMSA